MTIEERVSQIIKDYKPIISEYQIKDMLIEMATDQQKIDEDELHASMECEYMKALEKERERFAKKACKVFDEFLESLVEIDVVVDASEWSKEFKEALKEA